MGNIKRFVQAGLRHLPEPAKGLVRATAAAAVRCLENPVSRANLAEIINRNLPGGAVVCAKMRRGHKMMVDLRSGEYPAYYTGDDTRHIETILKFVRPTWVVLDVGANIGFWSVPLAKSVTKLYAFEPVSGNYSRLCNNLRLNALEGRVVSFPFGLSDHAAIIPISLREDFTRGSGTGNAAIVPDDQELEFARENIEICSLDSLDLPFDRLDFIKLDIEGHEPNFLRGAARTIAKHRPIIFTEVNNWFYELRGSDPTAVFEEWMAGAGYVCAIEVAAKWKIAALGERTGEVSDVFLLPKEQVADFKSASLRL
jgi:FkbM family methyltransferase